MNVTEELDVKPLPLITSVTGTDPTGTEDGERSVIVGAMKAVVKHQS